MRSGSLGSPVSLAQQSWQASSMQLHSTMKYSHDWSDETRPLTPQESEELDALRNAICDSPASVSPSKMERFTELFVRTLPKKL